MRGHTSKTRSWQIGFLVLCLVVGWAPNTMGDIPIPERIRVKGKPSQPVMRRGTRDVRVRHKQRVLELAAYQAGLREGWAQMLDLLRISPPIRPPRPKPGTGKPVKGKPVKGKPVVVTRMETRGNLTVRFVNPRPRPQQGPVAGLTIIPVVAVEQGRGAPAKEQPLPAQTTDAGGRIAVRDVPVPCVISWKIADETEVETRTPTWSFQNARQASLLLHPNAMRLASASPEIRDAEPPPVRLASTRLTSLPRPAASAAPVKVATYNFRETEVVLVRNVVDFRMRLPEDAKLYGPHGLIETSDAAPIPDAEKLEDEIPVRRQGDQATFTLPHFAIRGGGLPLRIARETRAGEWEGLVGIQPERADPYVPVNEIETPTIRLVRLKDVQVAHGVQLLERRTAIEAALRGKFVVEADKKADEPEKSGDRKSSKRRPPRTSGATFPAEWVDGESWWGHTPEMDIRFRTEPWVRVHEEERNGAPLKRDDLRRRLQEPFVADEIRLKMPEAGSVGGIQVGESEATLLAALGEPAASTGPGRELAYMEGGVAFIMQDSKVVTIALRRPEELLTKGTTAFTRRTAATVCLAGFESHPKAAMRSAQELARFLQNTGVVRLVTERGDADWVLSCRLEEPRVNKLLDGALPLQVDCEGVLSVDLENPAAPEKSLHDLRLQERARVDWFSEAAGYFGGILILRALLGKRERDLATIIGGAAAYLNLQRSMNRAAARLPRLVEAGLMNQLADRLYERIDYQARVAAIDYEQNELVVPLGERDGVTVDRLGGNATAFDVYVDGNALPGDKDNGLKADFYVAEVVSVSEHSCRCRLLRARRRLNRSQEAPLRKEPAPYMLARLPQASTAVVSVRMRPSLLNATEAE